jgi:fucose permease
MSPGPPARVAIAALFLVNGGLYASWISRIPGVRDALGLSEARLGLVLLGLGFGTFLGQPLTGIAVARWGSRLIARVTGLGSAVMLVVTGAAGGFASLFFALFGLGACLGALDVAMNAQAVLLERRLGRSIMSSFHGLWSLGGLLGALLGGLCAARAIPPQAHFAGVATALALVVVLADGRLLVDAPGRAPAGWVKPSRPLLAIGFVGAAGAVIENGIADWSGLYLHLVLGTGPGLATGAFAAFCAAMMIGRFAGDGVIDRFGARTLLRAGASLSGLALLAALTTNNTVAAIAAFLVAGIGMSVVFPIAFSAAGRLEEQPGTAIAAVAAMAYGGGLIGAPTIGFIAEKTSLSFAMGLLVAGCAVIAGLASGRMFTLPPR